MQNRKLLCSWCENEVVTTNTATMLALKHCLIVATALVAMSIFVTKQVAAKLFFCIVYNISTFHIKNKLSKRFLFFIRLSLLIFFQFKKKQPLWNAHVPPAGHSGQRVLPLPEPLIHCCFSLALKLYKQAVIGPFNF